ncbi:unnamed protein product [Leuciscus chuanchicus]
MRRDVDQADFGLSWTDVRCLADLDFADNIALIGRTQNILSDMTGSLREEASRVGLQINTSKTKIIHIGHNYRTVVPVCGPYPTKTGNVFNKDSHDVEAQARKAEVRPPQRSPGAAHSFKICKLLVSRGMRLKPLQWIEHNGEH